MTEIIFKYPGQKAVGVATRLKDGTLDHSGFTLVNVLPKKGDVLFDREVSEVVTDEALLKERTLLAQNNIETVAVLAVDYDSEICRRSERWHLARNPQAVPSIPELPRPLL